MSNKTLTLSIVIPAYNEERYLRACLESIASQTVKPHEVLLVNNNSTDATVKIARDFPFVKILDEPRQGVTFARNTGFNAASGSIIARIDADTIISPVWAATIQNLFSAENIDAVSGSVKYYDIPFVDFFGQIHLLLRRRMACLMGKEVFLYGSNMAIRRRTWHRVKAGLCSEINMHEDLDLAIHSNRDGYKVVFDQRMRAQVSLRRFDSNFADFLRYVFLNPKTYSHHRLKSQRHMYPVIILVLAFYLPLWILHRAYDVQTNRLSMRQFLSPRVAARVNPAVYRPAVVISQ